MRIKNYLLLFFGFTMLNTDMLAQCTTSPVGPDNTNMADFNSSGNGVLVMDKQGNPFALYVDDNMGTYTAIVRKYTNNKWSAVGNPNFINDETVNDMAIDKNGIPYVVVDDASVGNKATVMKFNGTAWTVVGTKGFSAGVAPRPKIAIDTAGTPYVIYADALNNSKATVMKFNGTTWVNAGSGVISNGPITYSSITFSSSDTLYAAFSLMSGGIGVMKFNGSIWQSATPIAYAVNGAVPRFLSLGLDKYDSIYVAFQDNSPYGLMNATALKYNGKSWDTLGVNGVSDSAATYESIAFDSANVPYVAYLDSVNGRRPTVRKYIGNQWVLVGKAGFSFSSFYLAHGEYLSNVRFNSKGHPCVLADSYTDDAKTVLWEFNGTTWQVVGEVGISGSGAGEPSITTHGNTPYVAYTDTTYQLSVSKFDGTNWTTVGNPSFSKKMVYNTSIAVDSTGIPYVAYIDYAYGDRVSVQKLTGTTWAYVGSPGFTSGSACNASIVVDGSGTPYIAVNDSAYSNKATVLKYNGTNWAPIGTRGFSAYPVNEISILIDKKGVLTVAYVNDTVPNASTPGYISICKFNGTSWNQVCPPTIVTSHTITSYNSLPFFIDKTNTPYLAANSNNNTGVVLKYNGTAWVSLGATPASPLNYNIAAITEDSSGTLYIASGGNLLEYNGSTWVNIERSLSHINGDGAEFAIDSSGTVYFEFLQGDGQTFGSSLFVQEAGCAQAPLVTEQITNSDKAIALYPNPAKNKVYLSSEIDNAALHIYSEDGSLLYTYQHFSGNEINTSMLPNGFYLVQLITENGNTIYKKMMILK